MKHKRGDHFHVPPPFEGDTFNFGKFWSDQHQTALRGAFMSNRSVYEMCELFGRDVGGIIRMLVKLRLICSDGPSNYRFNAGPYYYNVDVYPTEWTPEEQEKIAAQNAPKLLFNEIKETTMPALTFDDKQFINGRDASQMSDMEIFEALSKEALTIAKMEGSLLKSTKLTAHIEQRKEVLAQAVSYLDAR